MPIAQRSEDEIAGIREANLIVADVLATLAGLITPGISTADLEHEAARLIRQSGASPAFLGYRGYPACTCISVDEVIVHGIPNKKKLKEGQLVSMDVGVDVGGFFGDAAVTVPCGKLNSLKQRLLDTANLALARGIAAAKAGNRISHISRAIQRVSEDAGFSVVRRFVGHGIGTKLHEDPEIPNFYVEQGSPLLRPGMVLAIEPMVNAGTYDLNILPDGWTAVTRDRKPSAHFEHCVVVRADRAEILSLTPKLTWGIELDTDDRPVSVKHAG